MWRRSGDGLLPAGAFDQWGRPGRVEVEPLKMGRVGPEESRRLLTDDRVANVCAGHSLRVW